MSTTAKPSPVQKEERCPGSQNPLSLVNRRRFIAFTSGCFLGAVGGASRAFAATAKPIDIGPLTNFAKDEISEKFIEHNFFVIRHQERLYAAQIKCPHQGNDLLRDPKDATRIICTGHESVFDPEGLPIVGPAAHGLVRLGIAVNSQGRVLVDPVKEFPQEKWDDKGSYIAVKGAS